MNKGGAVMPRAPVLVLPDGPISNTGGDTMPLVGSACFWFSSLCKGLGDFWFSDFPICSKLKQH